MIQILFLSLSLTFIFPQEVASEGCSSPSQKIHFQYTLPPNAKGMSVSCSFGGGRDIIQVRDSHVDSTFDLCKGSVERTLTCYVVWGFKHKRFDAFKDSPKNPPITDTWCSVRVNGIRLNDTTGAQSFFTWDI